MIPPVNAVSTRMQDQMAWSRPLPADEATANRSVNNLQVFIEGTSDPARQTASANPEACVVRGRLTHIKWIRVDGHLSYQYKHDGVGDDKQSHSYRGLTELLLVEAALCAALDEGELTVDDVRTVFQRSLERTLTRQPDGLAGVMSGHSASDRRRGGGTMMDGFAVPGCC